MSQLQHALAPGLIKFAELMGRRLQRGVFTTEDSVRYTFFIAIVEALGIDPADIVLEYPHTKIARAKIDTWIPAFGGRAFAIEFKYDRPIPSKTNQPRTQKAGNLVKDLFRLAQIHSHSAVDALFVYLTSKEMAAYLGSAVNGLTEIFNPKEGSALRIDDRYLASRARTLRNAAGAITPCNIEVLLSRSLPGEYELRVYAVSGCGAQ
jgi:hypothetical protein